MFRPTSVLPALVAVLLFVAVFDTEAQQGFSFQGTVVSVRTGGPIPGVVISLVNPVIGRANPSMTDNYGRFGFWGIPFRPEPYYIEIYWGQELVYRAILDVQYVLTYPLVIRL